MTLASKTFFVTLLSAAMLTAAGCGAPEAEVADPDAAETLPPLVSSQTTLILVNTERIHASFPATFTGQGDVAVILANSMGNDPARWAPLVDGLSQAGGFTTVTFTYREEEGTHVTDTTALFNHLQTAGYPRIVCVGAGIGSIGCSGLAQEPKIAGMVLMSATMPAIEADFPKLFLTATSDPYGYSGATLRAYEQSAEPKTFKSYTADAHGPGLFFNAVVGTQVLADVMNFLRGIASAQ